MATCKAETTNNSPTSMESQMEEQSRCLCYPREDSPLAWLTQAHWACGQVTIKKVIFLPDVQSSQTETNLCKIPGLSTSWLYFCISMKSEVGSSLEKVKTESQEDPLNRDVPLPLTKCSARLPTKLPHKLWAFRRMKPNTGSHLPSEDVEEMPSCWLHHLTAAMPEYFTTPGSSE